MLRTKKKLNSDAFYTTTDKDEMDILSDLESDVFTDESEEELKYTELEVCLPYRQSRIVCNVESTDYRSTVDDCGNIAGSSLKVRDALKLHS